MNNETDQYAADADVSNPSLPDPTPTPKAKPFFDGTDWSAFWLTSLLTFTVYWFTLAPEVTLEHSGMLATAAFYGGIANPPGYPVWCMYAWAFTKIIPFSNVAWRVAVSSAFAGAVACGLIALMVSRGGAEILEGLRGFEQQEEKEDRHLRVISASVAGMALGFDSAFWERAVVVDVWPLSILFFAMVICLMLRWHYSPEQRRHLYAAVFGYGLALCNSEALAVAAIGFEFMVVFTKPALGRGLFVFATLMLATTSIGYWFKLLPDFWAGVTQIQWIWPVYPLVGVIVALVSGILIIKTSAIFTEWRKVLGCIFCLMLGLLPYLYLPIASMTTPPGNWGYPRTY
jgi:hypothetical protein